MGVRRKERGGKKGKRRRGSNGQDKDDTNRKQRERKPTRTTSWSPSCAPIFGLSPLPFPSKGIVAYSPYTSCPSFSCFFFVFVFVFSLVSVQDSSKTHKTQVHTHAGCEI